jgi:hypothetical protein
MGEGFSRRTLMRATGYTFLANLGLTNASADGLRHALYGTYYMRCPKCCNVDRVWDGTAEHVCQNEECLTQMFVKNKVTLVCRNHHENVVDLSNVDVLRAYACKTCGVNCEGKRG